MFFIERFFLSCPLLKSVHYQRFYCVLIKYYISSDSTIMQVWEVCPGQDSGAGLHPTLLPLRPQESQQTFLLLAQEGLRRDG